MNTFIIILIIGELTNSADTSDDELTEDSLRKGNHSLPLQYQHNPHNPIDVLVSVIM